MQSPYIRSTLLALALAAPVMADAIEVKLDLRLQPGRDLLTETVTDAITTVRMVEDRGIVAKSSGRLSSRPTTLHLVGSQTVRYVTGGMQSDGGFPVEMRFIDKTSHLKAADGQFHQLPDKNPLKGLRVMARVGSDGKVRPGSVELTGLEASRAERLRSVMAAVLDQAASIEPILLTSERSVPHELSMQIPVAGMTTFNLKMRISSRLLSIEEGMARIQQVFDMEFEAPAPSAKMTAEGGGGGTLLYEVATRTLISSETGSLMKFLLDTPDGVLEVQLDSKESQKMRTSKIGVR